MPVRKEKKKQLEDEMERLGIFEEDLIEKFILASGSGGQKVQKTHSCVYLKHIPTNIEIKCSQDRQREMNRFIARQQLLEKIKKKNLKEKLAQKKEVHKIRLQKKRRSKKLQQEILKQKRKRSEIKQKRKLPKQDEE